MTTKQHFYKKLRNAGEKLRPVLFPTETERKRKEHQEDERQDRYEKYIPHFAAKTYASTASWTLLFIFVYFMTFGISVIDRNEQIRTESQKKYDEVLDETNDILTARIAAKEYEEQHPVTNDKQMLAAWNYIMGLLHLDKNMNLNLLILLEGTIIGLTPTLALMHRKRLIDKMHAEKWKLVSPIDFIDKKIIYNMSKDSPNYFHHLTMSLTGPDKIKKYKKIAPSIIRGYMASHPEDNRAALVLKQFTGKTK